MSEEFKVEIVNPEKSFLSKENVTEVVVPAFEGEMGILKDHISIISFLKPGIIKVYSKSEENKYFVEDGIVEFKDNNLSILTSSIYNMTDLDKKFGIERVIDTHVRHTPRIHLRVIDQHQQRELLVGEKHGNRLWHDSHHAQRIRVRDELVRWRWRRQRLDPVGKNDTACSKLTSPKIRNGERFLEHHRRRLRPVGDVTLTQRNIRIIVAGRHPEPATDLIDALLCRRAERQMVPIFEYGIRKLQIRSVGPWGTTKRYIATRDVLSFPVSTEIVNGTKVVCSLLFRKSFAHPNGSSVGTICPCNAAPTTVANETISDS